MSDVATPQSLPMTHLRNILDDAAIVARIEAILREQWDPAGLVRDALRGGDTFYHDQTITVAAMLADRPDEEKSDPC